MSTTSNYESKILLTSQFRDLPYSKGWYNQGKNLVLSEDTWFILATGVPLQAMIKGSEKRWLTESDINGEDQDTLERFIAMKRGSQEWQRCQQRNRKGRQCDNYQYDKFCASHESADYGPDLPTEDLTS